MGDEHGLLLVFFLDCDLVVPGVAVRKQSRSQTAVESIT
jgi:hypothetical protein